MSDIYADRSDRTLPLSVANTGFLLDRLGEDCHTLQFLRELTQNSIEAILRTKEQRGEIQWDVDWIFYELEEVYKLSIIDTGDGMTGEEMVKYINQLSSSVSEQSIAGNYGVGAKVAAATRNPEGLIYLSWKDGEGAMIHLWRNPTDGEYGLRQFERPDGTYAHYTSVDDDVKPDLIGEHGTKVILLGRSIDEDTMTSPEGAASPSRWIAKYINSRYYDFSDGITVRAREGWMNPREDTDRNVLRTLSGQKPYLEEHAQESGRVRLTGAHAHWWILKDEPALSNNSGFIESSGHVAALYEDELYEMSTGRSGMAKLQQFGVILGHRRVVIYVQPIAGEYRRLTTNTARNQLLIDNESLPWEQWAREFQDDLPEEIDEHIQHVAEKSRSKDHSDTIRDRLDDILDLFKLRRYRPTESGRERIDPDATGEGAPRRADRQPPTSAGRTGKQGGRAGGVYSVFQKKDGKPGEEVKPEPYPTVRWISVKEETREPGDLEDRAARYLMDQNLLLINADFRVFEDMSDYWVSQYEERGSVREIVTDEVRVWYEQALIETVIGVQALRNSQEWSLEEIQKALSEDALTAAVMQRYHVNVSVKRGLGAKLGKAPV